MRSWQRDVADLPLQCYSGEWCTKEGDGVRWPATRHLDPDRTGGWVGGGGWVKCPVRPPEARGA